MNTLLNVVSIDFNYSLKSTLKSCATLKHEILEYLGSPIRLAVLMVLIWGEI